mmetsp:Transcript_5993/g.10017  ORF Transcript_5993/g.10017 Transcript_5993/m.10017 type:complete len:327 (+) Transcript_5993:116-1096(+)
MMASHQSEEDVERVSSSILSIEPSYANHNGFLMPIGFPVKGFESGLTYQARPNDLFIATYPKCGTTWMQHIVYLLLNHGTPIQPEESLGDIYPFLEKVGAEQVQQHEPFRETPFRLIKTHLSRDMMRTNPRAKYIVVTRNPKDCVVSFFHHTKGFEQYYDFAKGSFNTYFTLFFNGRVDFGDYFQCLKSWMDHRHDPNVLLLTYEDLLENMRDNLFAIAAFLDDDDDGVVSPRRSHARLSNYTNNLLANNEQLVHTICQQSSFESMQMNSQRWTMSQRSHTPFIRNGKANAWPDSISKHQAAQLDRRMEETFSQDDLEFLGDLYRA